MQDQAKWSENQQTEYNLRDNPHKITQNDKELSPWNNDEKAFRPQRYYQSIINQHHKQSKKFYNNSKSLQVPAYRTYYQGNKISKDFIQLVKLQKKGAYLHLDDKRKEGHQIQMNLVNVNLDDVDQQTPTYGRTIDNFYNNKHTSFRNTFRHKQQPTKVRMLKKITQKGQHQEGSLEHNQTINLSNYFPQLNNELNYQKMPKRQLRLFDRRKVHSTLQTNHNELLPKLLKGESMSDNKDVLQQGLVCKGEIIGHKDMQSIRKLKYREFQLQGLKRYSHQQNFVFLEQYSSER